MKKETDIHKFSPQLSAKEFMMLRSFALGVNEQHLQSLLEVNRVEFHRIKNSLLQKLEVQNMYTAVRKGLQLRLLDPINYMEETVKSRTLTFLEKNELAFHSAKDVAGNPIWRFYPLLLKYHYTMQGEEHREINKNEFEKKIPPKRD